MGICVILTSSAFAVLPSLQHVRWKFIKNKELHNLRVVVIRAAL